MRCVDTAVGATLGFSILMHNKTDKKTSPFMHALTKRVRNDYTICTARAYRLVPATLY